MLRRNALRATAVTFTLAAAFAASGARSATTAPAKGDA